MLTVKLYPHSESRNFKVKPEIIRVCNKDFKDGEKYTQEKEFDYVRRRRIEIGRIKIINKTDCCVRKK